MVLVLAIVAPGQGAQTPGFLAPWLEDAHFASRLQELSDVVGLDLVHYGTEADAETIKDTAIAQPLLVAAGLLAGEALTRSVPFAGVDVLAGHSVGEVTAAAAAGVLAGSDAIVFVRERANGMAEASALRPTTMAAVVRGEPDAVLAAIEAVGATAANNNGAGQIVAAGTVEQIEALKANPPERARVIGLSVAGAFHTEHMEPGRVRVEATASGMTAHDPSTTLLSNADGRPVDSAADAMEKLVAQLTRPVRWDLCNDTIRQREVAAIVEFPPAGTLVGIAKRELKGTPTHPVKTPADLDGLAEL